MKPFPTDAEIVAAIQLLARAQVLRTHEIAVYLNPDRLARSVDPDGMRADIQRHASQMFADSLADVIVGSDGYVTRKTGDRWLDSAANERLRLVGWVVAYADARRALDAPEAI